MGQILQNWRVFSATLFSAVLVVGAYMLARSIESPSFAQASTESALLQAIAVKDSDGDSLSDWEEALYGTDSHIIDTLHLGMTDGVAVAKGLIVPKAIADISVATSPPTPLDTDGLPLPPAEGTLTSAFTKSFLEFYLSAKQAKGGADLSEADMENIANETIRSLSSTVVAAPDYKSASDLTILGSGSDTLKTFAVNVEAVFFKNKIDATEPEVVYLKDALENGNVGAFTHIISIAKSYRNTAVGLATLPVPVELADDHLLLVNALMRKSEIASDLARVNDDPLATILALEQYPQALESLVAAFANIGRRYAAAGVVLPSGAPGAFFVNFTKDVAGPKP